MGVFQRREFQRTYLVTTIVSVDVYMSSCVSTESHRSSGPSISITPIRSGVVGRTVSGLRDIRSQEVFYDQSTQVNGSLG